MLVCGVGTAKLFCQWTKYEEKITGQIFCIDCVLTDRVFYGGSLHWRLKVAIFKQTRMWTNVQRDGRPAEHRWPPLFNAAKFGWRPLLECCAVTLNPLKLAGMPQTIGSISAASGRSSPYCGGHLDEILLLNKFFPIVDTCLSCRDIARQLCDGAQMATFLRVFSASRVQHVSNLHLKFALRPHHVWKYGRHLICDGWD